jgi:purine nucleosidase
MGTVGRCVVMGGAACTVGNVTPAAEFNVWVDPDAARIVFASTMPIEMVGWELSRHEANVSATDIATIREIDTPLAHFSIDCNSTVLIANKNETAGVGISLPDPVAMAIALNPDICTKKSDHFVEIEADSDLTRGMTVVDQIGVAQRERNETAWGPKVKGGIQTTVCWELDVAAFKKLLLDSLR